MFVFITRSLHNLGVLVWFGFSFPESPSLCLRNRKRFISSELRVLRTRQGLCSRELGYHSKQESGRALLGESKKHTEMRGRAPSAGLTAPCGHSLKQPEISQLTQMLKLNSKTGIACSDLGGVCLHEFVTFSIPIE